MDKIRVAFGTHIVRTVPEIPRERVYKCAGIVSVSGMHHHTGPLVHNNHIIILVHNVHRNIFRNDFAITGRLCHHNGNHILGAYRIVWLYRLVVHQDVVGTERLLDFVAGDIPDACAQKTVYTQRLLSGIHLHTVMLVKLLPLFRSGILHLLYAVRLRRLLRRCHHMLFFHSFFKNPFLIYGKRNFCRFIVRFCPVITAPSQDPADIPPRKFV